MKSQSLCKSARWWIVLGLVAAGAEIAIGATSSSFAESAQIYEPKFNAAGEMIRPEGWRNWMFVGTPLTPNSLNPPEAAFPEFHNVYIDPVSWAHYQRTGEFRDGTVFAKELVLVGATTAASGNGFFMGEFAGFEIAYKSAEHFPGEPGNWAYFSFGHKPEPYNETATKQPVAACAACHRESAAQDMVFTQYYPVVRAGKPK
jgi:hypothetical protein